MMDMRLMVLIPLWPLLAAAGIALRAYSGAHGDRAEPWTVRIALMGAVSPLLLLLAFAFDGLPGTMTLGTWFVSGDYAVPLSLTLDALAVAFALTIAFIATVTVRFSANYLHREAGFHRFFLALMLFVSGMLLIALAGNAALAFVGWELAGVSSWLLIGYAYERQTATQNAQRAFITNRVGDAGFVLAIALAFAWVGSLEWQAIAASRLDPLWAGLLALGFVIAALTKSAQVPFAPWIARALEGPTPSSAIFYGALLVHAGVYLLLRLQPLLEQAPVLLLLIAVLGVLTVVYGYLGGLVQTDVKSALSFATTTQVGLMFVAIGLGWFELATLHMIAHALWRAWQFLASPGYMHAVDARPAPPAPRWLAAWPGVYRAALQRFWLESLTDAVWVRPTLNIARDVRAIDETVVSRLVGLPADALTDALMEARERVVQGHGVAGALLEWAGRHLDDFESRLILQTGGGPLSRWAAQLGALFLAIEAMLEQPRYLLLLIMATFVVIL
jgi:NADH:ubiquinone oxidoreductase subunit 5 (subunit L)/multisubunit Na+/H+ antiporter MnhA subunit